MYGWYCVRCVWCCVRFCSCVTTYVLCLLQAQICLFVCLYVCVYFRVMRPRSKPYGSVHLPTRTKGSPSASISSPLHYTPTSVSRKPPSYGNRVPLAIWFLWLVVPDCAALFLRSTYSYIVIHTAKTAKYTHSHALGVPINGAII